MNRRKLIFGVILMSFVFIFSTKAQDNVIVVDQVVAVVGKNIIKLSDVENSYAQM